MIVDFSRELCAWITSFSYKTYVFLVNNCWLLILISLGTLRSRFSLMWSSSRTPCNNACNDSNYIVTRFRPIFETLSRRARYSSVSVQTEPIGKGKTHTYCGHGTISEPILWPHAELPATLFTFPTSAWILVSWCYNSRRSFWTPPNVCMYHFSNGCSTSIVASLNLSLISSRFLSVKTMGSNCVF